MIAPGSGLVVLYENGNDIFYGGNILGFGSQINVTGNPQVSTSGSLAIGSFFQLHVAYEEPTQVPGQTGLEVMLRATTGGVLGTPVNLSSNNGINDTRPHLSVNQLGQMDAVWQSQQGAQPAQIRVSRAQAASILVATGEAPAVDDLGGGVSYIGYQRGGSLYGRTFDGTTVGAEETLASGTTHHDLRIAVDAASAVHCVFLTGQQVSYVRRDPGGVFTTPLVRESGNAGSPPQVAAGAAGQVALVYSKGQQVYFQQLSGGTWTTTNITSFTIDAINPSVALDPQGFAHVVYQLFGAIFYTTNIPPPTAQFQADITSGMLPHAVAFQNQSTGNFGQSQWDFGDGTTSTDLHPVHEYRLPGTFTVTLTTIGPGGSAQQVLTNYISTTLPPDVIKMPAITVVPGQTNVILPILGTTPHAIQGFQLALYYNELVAPVSQLTLQGTLTGNLQPDFFVVGIVPDLELSSVTAALVLETMEPFTGVTIPGGNNRMLAGLQFDVPPALPVGTMATFVFSDDIGIANIFAPVQGASIHPFPLHGKITIVDPVGQVLFQRGDSNRNGNIDISDAIFTLGFLFSLGTPPGCPDSADANDNGSIDIADAIFTLGYLFTNGTNPPYPFPAPGLDPTPDSLGVCMP